MNPRRDISPETLAAMRSWLREVCNCTPAAVDELSDFQIIAAIERRYFGGLLAFIDADYPQEVRTC